MKRRKMVLAVLLASALSAEGAMTGAMTVQADGFKVGVEKIVSEEEAPDSLKANCFEVNEKGEMTLFGQVDEKAVSNYANKDQVTSIVALEGTILPKESKYLFSYYSNVVKIDLSKADSSAVESMDAMFDGCRSLTSLNLTGLDTSNVKYMAFMFMNCDSMEEIDVSGFDTSNVEDMQFMFADCSSLKALDLSKFNTKNVASMVSMFEACEGLETLDLSNFDTSNVMGMSAMFIYCRGLKKLNVSSFDTSQVIDMSNMFSDCESLKTLDLGNFVLMDETFTSNMFTNDISLTKLTLGENFAGITKEMYLPNPEKGWKCGTGSDKISGDEECAVFSNSGKNTYYVIGAEIPEEQNPEEQKTEEEESAKKTVTEIFTDVIKGEWYVDAIQYVYDRSIMNGIDAKLFGTKDVLTRAQFVTVLHNMEGQPKMEYKEQFTDVPKDKWYTNPVLWAYENKITAGVDTNLFGTDDKITREQLATMLYKYAKSKEYKSAFDEKALESFPDTEAVSEWALEAMQWAVTNQVMNGKKTGNGNILDPKGEASRAECAQMIRNMLENTVE